jgi:hypothetical protein
MTGSSLAIPNLFDIASIYTTCCADVVGRLCRGYFDKIPQLIDVSLFRDRVDDRFFGCVEVERSSEISCQSN